MPKDFPIEIIRFKNAENFNQTLHLHNTLELNYIIEGWGMNIIEGNAYPFSPGDLYIINNMEYHMAIFDTTLNMIVVHFDPGFILQNGLQDYDYLKPFFSKDVNISNKVSCSELQNNELANIILEICREWDEQLEGYKMIIRALVMKLLAVLYRNFKVDNKLDSDAKSFYKGFERVRDVISYINDNYRDPIKLEELAQIAHMNKTYFCVYFKNIMQMTVSDYLELVRVNAASRLLLTTNLGITDIAYQSGFTNSSHLCKVFRKTKKTSPGVFRQGNK